MVRGNAYNYIHIHKKGWKIPVGVQALLLLELRVCKHYCRRMVMKLIKKYKKIFICIPSIIVGTLIGLIVYYWTDFFLLKLLTSIIVIVLSLIIILKTLLRK